MPVLFCPICGDMTPRQLEASLVSPVVDYYRCGNCAHVWTADKATHTVVTHITPIPKKPTPGGGAEPTEA